MYSSTQTASVAFLKPILYLNLFKFYLNVVKFVVLIYLFYLFQLCSDLTLCNGDTKLIDATSSSVFINFQTIQIYNDKDF